MPGVRVLGIETSCQRGSVALVEDGHVVAHAVHDEPNRHGERILPLIDESMAEIGWDRSTVERIGVGVGPGSFTGLRVGIALATGLSLGLRIPAVGIGSLAAIAANLPGTDRRLRVVLRDARRDEFFLAAYDPEGNEIVSPHAIPQASAVETVRAQFGAEKYVVIGSIVEGLPTAGPAGLHEPDAAATARLAAGRDPADHPAAPQYVRGPNAIKPKLPPSPLAGPRSA